MLRETFGKWVGGICVLLLSMTTANGLATEEKGKNLFENGDFEAADPEDTWGPDSPGKQQMMTEGAHGGKRCLKLLSQGERTNRDYKQGVLIDPSRVYQVICWVKVTGEGVFSLRVKAETEAGLSHMVGEPGVRESEPVGDTRGEWKRVELEYRLQEDEMKSRDICLVPSPRIRGKGEVLIDDVEVREKELAGAPKGEKEKTAAKPFKIKEGVLNKARASSLRVPLDVCETAGISRKDWPVSAGMPLPEGVISDARALSIVDDKDKPVPCHFDAIGRWPKGSIKWALARFQADVEANKSARYFLCLGKESAPPPRLEGGLVEVKHAGNHVKLDNGILEVTCNRRETPKRGHFIENVILHGGKGDKSFPILDSSGVARLQVKCPNYRRDFQLYRDRLGAGKRLPKVLDREDGLTGEVEYPGDYPYGRSFSPDTGGGGKQVPICAPGGSLGHQHITVTEYSDQSFVKVRYYFYNGRHVSPLLLFREFSLRFPLAFSENARVRFGGADRKEFGMGARLVQGDYERYGIYEGEKLLSEGKQAGGWVDVRDAEKGVMLYADKFWQMFPKSLETSREDGIILGLWPRETGFDFVCQPTFERTQDIYLYFYRPGEGPSPEDMAKALSSPLWVRMPPEWFAETLGLGALPLLGEDELGASMRKTLLQWLEALRAAHQKNGELDHGWMNYGDFFVGGDYCRGGYLNLEDDVMHALFLAYAVTGERGFFDMAEDASWHYMDVDTTPQGYVFMHRASSHIGAVSMDANHIWSTGLCDWYCLTGNERAFERADAIASSVISHYHTDAGGLHRQLGWSITAVEGPYLVRPHEGRFGDIKRFCGIALGWQNERGNFTWDKENKGPMDPGSSESVILSAMIEYHWLTGDKAVEKGIVKGAEAIMRNLKDPGDAKPIIYASEGWQRSGCRWAFHTTECLAYAYVLTGEERFKVAARNALKEFENVTAGCTKWIGGALALPAANWITGALRTLGWLQIGERKWKK